jgi:hypothetical protein
MLEHRFDASRPLPRHGKGFMDNAVFIEVEGAGQNLKSNGLLETVIDLRSSRSQTVLQRPNLGRVPENAICEIAIP